MEKFIPYEKLSKKEKRKMDLAKRQTWGELNPVTRKPTTSKAYNRNKARNWKRESDPIPGILLHNALFSDILTENTREVAPMKDGTKYILVADDDREIREIVSLLLSSEGYAVLTAEDGIQAARLASGEIALYLLDVNMPGQSGILAASQIRKQFETPIVFLTAYSSESDKVMGFSVGADDYIVKPFSNAELLMRVRAILRRSAVYSVPQTPKNQIAISDLILDLDSQCVLRGGETMSLTYTEFKILELLARNKKKIFSLEHIYQSIWEDNAVGNDAIMVHIKNIRKKLGDSSRNPAYIKTAWGKGYYID